jgi:hypothetical protein
MLQQGAVPQPGWCGAACASIALGQSAVSHSVTDVLGEGQVVFPPPTPLVVQQQQD